MGSNTDDYICVECGYMERYLDDKEKLKAVAKAWKQVG
jgi:Zn ribbon nucleic-acid-binding protein